MTGGTQQYSRVEELSSPRFWKRAALAAFCVLAAPMAASAQGAGGWQNPDVYALRDEVKQLSREVAAMRAEGLGGGGGGGAEGAPAVSGDVYVRLERLDQSVRSLTGAVEELDQRLRASARQSAAKQAEFEFRLSRLEAGKKGKPTGPIPGAAALSQDAAPGRGAPTGGRLQPLRPENSGPGAPPSVLGSLQRQSPGGAVAARPIYDSPPQGAAPAGARSSSAAGQSLFDSAAARLLAGDHDAAEEQFRSFIKTNPNDERVPRAHYLVGDIQFSKNQMESALQSYRAVLKQYPDSEYVPDALYMVGEITAQWSRFDAACTAFRRARVHPDATAKLISRVKLAQRKARCGRE